MPGSQNGHNRLNCPIFPSQLNLSRIYAISRQGSTDASLFIPRQFTVVALPNVLKQIVPWRIPVAFPLGRTSNTVTKTVSLHRLHGSVWSFMFFHHLQKPCFNADQHPRFKTESPARCDVTCPIHMAGHFRSKPTCFYHSGSFLLRLIRPTIQDRRVMHRGRLHIRSFKLPVTSLRPH